MKRVLVSWSSGKDSAWLVHVLRQTTDVEIGGLLTTVNEAADRVAMHAVRTELLQAQARALGLPLRTVFIPSPCPNEVYERAMAAAVAAALGGRLHARRVRRSLPRGRPAVSRGEARWQRPDAALSAVRRGHDRAGPRHDRERPGRAHHVRESCRARSIVRGPRVRCGAHPRSARNSGSVRRAGRVPYVRVCRPDVLAADSDRERRGRRT